MQGIALFRTLGNGPDGAETGFFQRGNERKTAFSEHICTNLQFSPARPGKARKEARLGVSFVIVPAHLVD